MSNDMKLEPEAIWLSPRCDAEAHHGEGRSWANPAPEAACDDCGLPWGKYVRADLASHQPQREAVGGKMLNVARRNLRTFLGLASFKSENDREAALNCLEVIEAELSCLNGLVAVLRSALAADVALTTPAPAVSRDDQALFNDICDNMAEVLKPLPGEE